MNAKSTRRAFLKTVGAAAAALPFFSMLEESAVAAETGALPLKFVGVSYLHAKPARFYYRRPGETDTSYDLSYADCALKPLAPYKDKTTIFEGFGYAVGDGDAAKGELYVPMHGALGILLTNSASKQKTGDTAYLVQNASLDKYLAQKLGGGSPFRSVALSSEADGNWRDSSSAISFSGPGAPDARLSSPQKIWEQYFKLFNPPSVDPAEVAAAARKRAIDKSMFDYIAGDISRLQKRLGPTERQKLDQHLTAVRDIENRLLNDPVISAQCVKPPQHLENGNPKYQVTTSPNGGDKYFDLITNYQVELLAELLICGLTRFATVSFAGTSGAPTESYCDMALPVNFHDNIAHLSESTVAVDQQQASMCRYYFSKVAKLMDILQAASCLDSTLILVGSEGGHGAGHSHDNVPLVLCGGANGTVRMGRRVLAPGRTAPSAIGNEPGGNKHVSHAPVLVGIANAFGDTITSYGTAADPTLTAGIPGYLT